MDCIAAMDRLPAGCADVVFADPPYLLSRGGTTCSGGRRVSVDKGAWDRGRGGHDAEHGWSRRWLRSAQRVLKASGTIWVCGNYQSIWSVGWAMQSMGYSLVNAVSWCKPNAPPNIGCRSLTHSTEMLVWASPAPGEPLPHVFNDAVARTFADGKQLRDYWVLPASVPRGERDAAGKRHPAQKPVELVRRVLAVSLPPGGVVVDPFMGSATAGVAAAAAGASAYVGVDSDRGWVDYAAARLGGAA